MCLAWFWEKGDLQNLGGCGRFVAHLLNGQVPAIECLSEKQVVLDLLQTLYARSCSDELRKPALGCPAKIVHRFGIFFVFPATGNLFITLSRNDCLFQIILFWTVFRQSGKFPLIIFEVSKIICDFLQHFRLTKTP